MNINIVPKVGENVSDLDVIKEFSYDRLEIQLLTDDIPAFSKKAEDFLKAKDLKSLIIHLPSCICDWECILMNNEVETQFMSFVRDCCTLSNKYNTEIYILGHLETKMDILEKVKFKEWFGFLIRMVSDSKVYFLVENPSTEPYRAKTGEPFYKFVKSFNNPRVKCCLDICHYKVIKSLLGERYNLPEDLGQYVKSVHFSDFPMNSHPYDKNTHGIRHKNVISALCDLDFLNELGVDLENAFIVTEINETDYVNRPDLIQELRILKKIEKEHSL